MRLIDADAMQAFAKEMLAEGKDGWANGVPYEWAYALTAVDMQPTVDAVPVVRCGECIHRVRESWAKCTGRRPDEFCSDGERRFKDATD